MFELRPLLDAPKDCFALLIRAVGGVSQKPLLVPFDSSTTVAQIKEVRVHSTVYASTILGFLMVGLSLFSLSILWSLPLPVVDFFCAFPVCGAGWEEGSGGAGR